MTDGTTNVPYTLEKRVRIVRMPGEHVKELEEPISIRELTTREKIVLLEASKLHGSRFPPWTSPPVSSDFERQSGQPYFM